MLISLSNQNPKPLYEQIVEQVQELIVKGDLSAGETLPSIRQLASELTTSVITVRRAYLELEKTGFIITRPGIGTFVADLDERKRREIALKSGKEKLQETIEGMRRSGLSDEDIRHLFIQVMRGGINPL